MLAVLSYAGAYVSGDFGSNECPAGSVRIETEAACRIAVTAAGKTPDSSFVVTESSFPRGCLYEILSNFAYFNAHPFGGGSPPHITRLLCAAAATGAPPLQTGAWSRTAHVCGAANVCVYVCV